MRRISSVESSMELFRKANQLIPGGTQLISRRPSRFAYGVSPVYADRALGSHIWDVDGNEYIDWVSDIGAVILGYCDPVVDEAVKQEMERGVSFTLNHRLEVALAEALVDIIPCAEMTRYAKGGGDACAVAVRIARGTTGRDRILFCGYHGWHDWYLAANLDKDEALDEHLFPGIDPIGVPQALKGSSIPFAYGDIDALRNKLEQYRGEVAAIIMEPLRSELPPPDYLENVRALASEYQVILIFDEVSTGFRLAPGGVQEYTGVVPDMAVFAKSISNGYPMGAVVGKKEVMEPASQMFISSTYWSDGIGLCAALTTLREIRNRDACKHMKSIGERLQQGINEQLMRTGLSGNCGGLFVHPSLQFEIEDPHLLREVTTLYIQEMSRRGCLGYTSFYLNAAQTTEDVDITVDAAGEVFKLIQNGLDKGTIHSLLDCELAQDSFRRLVR
ncbi:MAG: aminotransferase class III-fold pyridoxal phosphate-dependent enzyme [Planctomycetes bacterium]|nr:aminotransferase class III-fold pyridoxal phosphate-dependent enzyme [Planctomycetota bacterium]